MRKVSADSPPRLACLAGRIVSSSPGACCLQAISAQFSLYYIRLYTGTAFYTCWTSEKGRKKVGIITLDNKGSQVLQVNTIARITNRFLLKSLPILQPHLIY